jgi:CDGSH-type Zn-finger protein
MTDVHRDETTVRITPYPDGPLIVRGPVVIDDVDGHVIADDGATVALCRCGRSASKPFCDGSHKRTGFSSTVLATRPDALPEGVPAAD